MGLIANEIVAQVLERCDIAELIAGYIPLKRAGRNFKALCPFHNEKSSSFVVSPDKQIFHCFGCGAGGNAIGFVMQQERLEFPEAVRFLADKVGVAIPESSPATNQTAALKQEVFKVNESAVEYFQQNLLTKNDSEVKNAREYLKDRGIRLEDVKQFKLGFALDEWDGLNSFLRSKGVDLKLIERSGLVIPRESKEGYYDRFRDRIVFPIFDVKSQCVGFGARTMKDEKGAKYINSPDTPVYTKGQHLFGLQLTRHAIAKKDFVIVVEGYMDMIIPFQYGVDNIVASLGTALTVEQIRLLRRYTNNIVMLFDADAAGQAAIVRSLDLLIEQEMNVRVASLAAGEDPDSYIRKFGLEEFDKRIQAAQSLFDFKLQWLTTQFDPKNIEQRAEICDQMLATIYKITNEVIRFGYLKQLGDRLGLPEQVLLKEGKKVEASLKAQERPAARQAVQLATARPLNVRERQVVSLLINDANLINVAKVSITPSEFQDDRARIIIEKLFEFDGDKDSFSISSFLNSFDDLEVQRVISNISAEEGIPGQDSSKILKDCLLRIKEARLKEKKQSISELIRQAEISGDAGREKELLQELDRLPKAINISQILN